MDGQQQGLAVSSNPGAVFRAARDFLVAHQSDYEVACRDFRWPRFDNFNWALDHFDSIAAGNSDTALWIVDEGGRERKCSFEYLRLASNRCANYLKALGVTRGDRMLLMLPNRAELWELMLAAIKLGVVVCPATTILSTADTADRLDRGGIKVIVADASCIDRFVPESAGRIRLAVGGEVPGWNSYAGVDAHSDVFEADARTRADDPCMLYFTSGTTSRPKMVLHSHVSYPVGHLSTLYWLGLRAGDLHLNISSPGWAKHAWSCLFAPWAVGATIFIYNQARFDAARTLETIARCGVTTLCAPPTAWRSFIIEDLKRFPVRLRQITSAGEPLNPEVIDRVKDAWGIEIREGYGQSESTAMLGNPPGLPVRPGSMGRPLPGYDITLLDAEGAPAAEGEVSVSLSPRPAGLMAGYAGEPEKTARALGGSHYGTSDIASRDADGYFWYVGRNDDVFKSSDYRISPFELESVLIEHAAIAEAAVVESPDSRRMCVPKACVSLKPGYEPGAELAQSIFAFTLERLAPYQKIRILEFCELPKTVSGKIRRADLRADERRRRAEGGRRPLEFFDSDFPQLARAGASR